MNDDSLSEPLESATDGKQPPSTTDLALERAREDLAAIQQLLERVQVVANTAQDAKQGITASWAEAQLKLTEISAYATQAVAANTKITDHQAVVATKSDHIQKAQEHADAVRANLDRALTSATQQATATEAQQALAQHVVESLNSLLADAQKTGVAMESDKVAAVSARQQSEEAAAISKSLADKAEQVESRLDDYELRLKQLNEESIKQLSTITALLPGATSVGLAHSFDERRQTFLKPHNRWQWIFVGSVLAIVALTVSGLWHVYQSPTAPSYDELVRLWLSRLPVAGALLWLALHASHESALAKRLEEDYGYKAAIAAAFVGFQKQMKEIDAAGKAGGQLDKLCDNTLTAMASPPGRIYDKHELTVSPTTELAEAAKQAAGVVSASKP